MCCEPCNDFKYDEINGECPNCSSSTVDGQAFDVCYYSSVECSKCGSAPCDGSC